MQTQQQFSVLQRGAPLQATAPGLWTPWHQGCENFEVSWPLMVGLFSAAVGSHPRPPTK